MDIDERSLYQALMQEGRLEEAGVLIEDEIQSLRSRLVEALELRAQLRTQTGAWEEAVQDHDELLSIMSRESAVDRDLVTVIGNRAWLLIAVGRSVEALEEIDRALELRPEDPAVRARLYLNRGLATSRLGDLDAALTDYSHALSLAPFDSLIYFDRACALVRLGRLQEAFEDLKKAVRLDQSVRLTARLDPDLDPLRTSPQYRTSFEELVGDQAAAVAKAARRGTTSASAYVEPSR